MRVCPECRKNDNLKIVDSRPDEQSYVLIRRRRECSHCGHRFNTYEIPVEYVENVVRELVRKQLPYG